MARLFVAVWPPDDVLELVQRLPREDRSGVRWTTRDQWHVTLRFLGPVDVEPAVAAFQSVQAIATEAVLGPRPRRLGRSVLVVPVAGIEAVAAAVVAATAGVGKPPERRPFHGHLTLARLQGRPGPLLTDVELHASWPVTSVCLVESKLHPKGARYETVAEVPLAPEVRSAP